MLCKPSTCYTRLMRHLRPTDEVMLFGMLCLLIGFLIGLAV